MAGAAVFDLDRTLLAGASGSMYAEALRAADLLPAREIPGERLLYGLFTTIGETLPSMAISRQAMKAAKGQRRDEVRAVAQTTAPSVAARLQPYARALLDQHRRAGRPLVLATTTPFDLVESLAGHLGFDAVVATRFNVAADGRYDGTIDGPFVWSNGKLSAVRAWAAEAGISLGETFAYSDSVFDAPLLMAVGHPVAVNPDPRLRVLALARRWPVIHLDVPPGIPKFLGIEPQRALLSVAGAIPELSFPYARFVMDGVDRIAGDGGLIVCANHRSYFDVVALGLLFSKVGRPVRFLGKKELFDAPIAGSFMKMMGGIRVDRGTGSAEPLEAAASAIAAGQIVVILPQGTIPRGAEFFDPVLRGRSGAARLAQITKAPVVPVGLWGTERVWPRRSRVPDMLNVLDPPTVTVTVGAPVDLKYRSVARDTERIMSAIVALLPDDARARHEPTAAELARTYPPGARPGVTPAATS
ncbi:MAG: HAD-IB family hydrolase [Acidimicrobiia bacterium]